MNWRKGIVPADKYCVTLVPKAKDDIINIGDYIANTLLEPDISRKFINGLRLAISDLEIFPYKFPLTQDELLMRFDIRCMPYKNYYVFYKVVESLKIVSILRIGYSKRDRNNILKNLDEKKK